MPTLSERLQLLAAGPVESTAIILTAALPRATPEEIAPICIALAATGVPDAVMRAVSLASKLDDAAQRELAQQIVITEPALRAVITAGDTVTSNLVGLLSMRECADAAPTLARLVSTAPWQAVREKAAEAMLSALAAQLGPTSNPALLPSAQARRIDESLAEAVDRYREHRSDAVLHALAIMARAPGQRVSAILEDSGHPAMFALRHAVARPDRLEIRRQMLRLLTTPALTSVIQRNLHNVTGPQAFDDMLSCAHLLRAPARKKAMRAVDRPMRCVPSMSESLSLSREGQACLPLLIESLGLPTPKRLEHLADLVAIESTLGRLRSVMALSRYEADDARSALRPLAFDRSPWVARLAANAAIAGAHRDGRAAIVAAGLANSPHTTIARRARWIASRANVAMFFEHWTRLEPTERVAAAMTVLAHEEPEFVRIMADVLNTGSRSERLLGITLVQRLQLIGELEQELIVLAGVTDSHIASAAVTALGTFHTERTQHAIRVALRHTDPRVRANAVEALARHDAAGTIETLAPLSDHRHNRVRANSVLALLRHHQPVGAVALRSMLGDDDPMHRVSGIWVAGRAGAGFAREDLRTLMERDTRMEIRKRAAQTLRRIDTNTGSRAHEELLHA